MQLIRPALLGLALITSVPLGCATAPAPQINDLAFELPDLDNQSVSLSTYRGRVVLVDVWATWCKPCAESFPVYAKWQRAFEDRGFQVLAVSVDAETDAVRRFISENDVPFRILRDPGGTLPERTGLSAMPTAYFIGRDGKVAFVHQGYRPEDEDELLAKLQALLDEPPPASGAPAKMEPTPGAARTETSTSS